MRSTPYSLETTGHPDANWSGVDGPQPPLAEHPTPADFTSPGHCYAPRTALEGSSQGAEVEYGLQVTGRRRIT